MLTGDIGQNANDCIRGCSEQLGCEVTEMNVKEVHVHRLAMALPNVSLSGYLGSEATVWIQWVWMPS